MAAQALTSLLLQKLATATIDQVGRVLGVRSDLHKLRSALSAIQSVILAAEERSVTERDMHDWVSKLKDAAYDADDLLDEFQTYSEWRSQHTSMSNKVRIFFSPRSNPLLFRIKMSSEIKAIVEKMDMIAQERTRYQLRVDPPYETRQHQMEPRMTAAAVNENEVYGRDDDVKQILKLLLKKETDKEEEDLSVVTIFAKGGLGKTTLAQLVYKHEKVLDEKFDQRIWVCVSDPFDIKRIVNTIIESIEGRCDLLQFEPAVGHIQHILANKKFLLVLDDVWNENEQEWEKVKDILAVGSKGSKILVTTRSFKIASMMGTPYCLGVLSEDACWRLFEKRAFTRTEYVQRDPSLEAIGREIVAKCRGSPLAAKSMGSLMRFKTGRREWLAVRDSDIWRSTNEGNQIMASLRLSYNHLSPHLKQCFAYCSIFPKDTSIKRDELVLHWIALGFIPSNTSSESAVNKGNEYFNNLVWISFLDEDSTTRDVLEYYKMHDLVHDLAKSVAGDEHFICYADQEATIPPRCRFYTLVGSLEKPEMKHLFRESSKVRALRLEGSNIINSPILFSSLTRLRVLDMGDSPVKEVHASIKRLQHLRYFTFKGSHDLLELPNSIGRVRNLLALRASSCSKLRSLPQSFTSLQNMQTLDLSCCDSLGSLPESLDNLKNLQTLDLSHCFSLGSLPESLDSLQGLRILNLKFCTTLVSLPESIGNLAKLRTLDLSLCEALHSLPQSLGNLSNLEELDIRWCEAIVELPESIGRLDKLRTLQISGCEDLLSLPQSLSNLSNLEKLDLVDCKGTTELPEGMGNMANLRHLQNMGMSSLRGMPLGIGKMRSLVTLQLFVVGEVSNHSSIAEMQHLNLIAGNLKLTHLENVKSPGDAARANLKEKHQLRKLCLEWYNDILDDPCSIHEEVLADLIPHPNLEELEIERYPGINFLNRVRMMGVSIPNLVVLTLSGLKCLPSFDGGLLQLKRLYLKNMPDVEKWLAVADGVELYPRLVELGIRNCPKMHAEPCIPASLKELQLVDSGELLIFVGRALEGIGLQDVGGAALERLHISSSNKMVDLPEAIRTFTSLRSLQFSSCPNLVELPEWLRELTSLQDLVIYKCNSSLEERCRRDTGEDWPIIAHIPYIQF